MNAEPHPKCNVPGPHHPHYLTVDGNPDRLEFCSGNGTLVPHAPFHDGDIVEFRDGVAIRINGEWQFTGSLGRLSDSIVARRAHKHLDRARNCVPIMEDAGPTHEQIDASRVADGLPPIYGEAAS